MHHSVVIVGGGPAGSCLAWSRTAVRATCRLDSSYRSSAAKLNVPRTDWVPFGEGVGKLRAESAFVPEGAKPRGKLVLVSAINPTPAGEGKTTTTISLGAALAEMGRKAIAQVKKNAEVSEAIGHLRDLRQVDGGTARGTLFDVVAAEDAYFEAATSYIQALSELDAARYVLLSRTGRLLEVLRIDTDRLRGEGEF